MTNSELVQVFISYAHEDEELKNQLVMHLSPLVREGRIVLWQDRDIPAGSEFDPIIRTRLDGSALILLLISASFVASEYCWEIEMKRALESHQSGHGCVIPIIGRLVDWSAAPFRNILAVPTDGRAVTSWRNRDEAWTNVAKHVRQTLSELRVPKRVPYSATSTAVTNLPPRHPNFVGHAASLHHIRDSLQDNRAIAIVHAVGLGGVGKTTLALEYAHRHADEYRVVWWVRAHDDDILKSDLRLLARTLAPTSGGAEADDELLELLRSQLAKHEPWLLIFDDAKSPARIESYLNFASRGHVLITTRAISRSPRAHFLAMDFLPRADSVELLLRQTGTEDRKEADALAAELGDLPLALTLSAAYVEHTGVSLKEYRELLQASRHKSVLAQKRHTIGASIQFTIDRVGKELPLALEVLFLAVYFERFPRSLLGAEYRQILPGSLPVLAGNVRATDKAIATLLRYALVTVGEAAILVHPIVRGVVQDRLKQHHDHRWAAAAEQMRAAIPA